MNRNVAFSAFLGIALASGVAWAQVRHEGDWPVEVKHVSIDATHVTRSDAIMRVAKEAGWSVVLRDVDEGKPMDLHVHDQPADKVLDVVLADGAFVAKRDGTLITISSDAHAPPPPPATVTVSAAPPPIPPPAATTRGEDRIIRGGDITVGADETVHDVTVFGGSAEILGTATGNVTVLGGSAHLKKGAHVVGNATAVGGSIDVDDGAQVDGDVGVVGGSVDRHKGSRVGGKTHKSDEIHIGSSSSSDRHSLLREVSDATTRAAMLFVFGAVLFALAGNKMNQLRVEAASRPMRAFALGIVGGLLFLLSCVLIAITVIGIPVAVVLLLGGVFAAYAGICAVLATVGKALIGHKSDNPHVHLLVGCVLFLVSGAIPFVNGLVTLGVVLTGIGVIVATRGAGIGTGRAPNSGPYRTEATIIGAQG